MEIKLISLALQIGEKLRSENVILYDGECIYCQKYVEFVRLKDRLGPVALESLREHPDLVTKLRAAGIEPNEGMVFVQADKLYWGADAVNRLAQLSSAGGFLNTLQRVFMRNATLSKIAYPALKFGRKITLILRGRKVI